LEAAYEACPAHGIGKLGIAFRRQVALPIRYDSSTIEPGYRLDLLVDSRVVVEVKAVERLTDVHRAHLLSYLKLGGYRLGTCSIST
jgi:GxxExxY protein